MIRNVFLHLRIPFSVFLLPVYLFALSQTPTPNLLLTWWSLVIIHLLLYPASNAYNSYYDKDEGSIGLLEVPPPVSAELLYTAWLLDILAIFLALWAGMGLPFVMYLLIYGTISKAYSHPSVRLKKYPLLSWFIVGLFQGALTYLATVQVIGQVPVADLLQGRHLVPALICTSNLWAVYPLTQVYQHEEDARRGDLTFSRMVGIPGTFRNAALFFSLSFAGFLYYFLTYGSANSLIILVLCMGPVLAYFGYWWRVVLKNQKEANFRHTMRMNIFAGIGLNLFFGLLCLYPF
ncbi:UbiA family prenyltransferase [Telluribacter sp.]|jgi:1,4-dihydroxy-2-naphthoate octaprenyltransferase|uniref:UbiA family prenyltransferase n=1 Tax=Telluribacter sp. TaxID=1978767 RepID=UPI002E0EFEBF|nr:UbiA family prenyltransferase [Telluribacter sp.]